MSDSLLTTYQSLPVSFTHGQGAWLWDAAGKKYLDALGGIAVCALGHAHPEVTAAICEQAGKLLHTSNVYQIENQRRLADQLTRLAAMEQAFFCNSGAEANEAALKLCRLYGHKKGIHNPHVIVMEKAFHGRTLATLSASGSRKVQAGFEPLVQGFIRAPFNDMKSLETIARHSHEVVAVLLEPIQGEGGIYLPDANYLLNIRELCDANDWLMVLDEVQTGVGRTGKFYNYQHHNLLPDIVTTAKALGNGIPIGACLARGKALDLFHAGNHGSTFGGNPFATHVAHTVLSIIERDHLVKQAATRGDQLQHSLRKHLADNAHVVDIRGQGLMIGIELGIPCRELLRIGLEQGILFSITADKVVRILPPYIISEEETEEIGKRIAGAITTFFTDRGDSPA